MANTLTFKRHLSSEWTTQLDNFFQEFEKFFRIFFGISFKKCPLKKYTKIGLGLSKHKKKLKMSIFEPVKPKGDRSRG